MGYSDSIENIDDMPIGFSKIAIMSLRISKRNRILKTHETDCVSIAAIHNPAKVLISIANIQFRKNN